jgi:hypothetical protein
VKHCSKPLLADDWIVLQYPIFVDDHNFFMGIAESSTAKSDHRGF